VSLIATMLDLDLFIFPRCKVRDFQSHTLQWSSDTTKLYCLWPLFFSLIDYSQSLLELLTLKYKKTHIPNLLEEHFWSSRFRRWLRDNNWLHFRLNNRLLSTDQIIESQSLINQVDQVFLHLRIVKGEVEALG